jgi:hypothetical protein
MDGVVSEIGFTDILLELDPSTSDDRFCEWFCDKLKKHGHWKLTINKMQIDPTDVNIDNRIKEQIRRITPT